MAISAPAPIYSNCRNRQERRLWAASAVRNRLVRQMFCKSKGKYNREGKHKNSACGHSRKRSFPLFIQISVAPYRNNAPISV